jgi:putative ATP-dependent endonuclease of the OLD family
VQEGERDHTFLAVEEPEAHLHPHVQRLVYRYFLKNPDEGDANRLTTILTTHSAAYRKRRPDPLDRAASA